MDWTNSKEVIAMCKQLNTRSKKGFESSVIKLNGRNNYNITHTSEINRLYGKTAEIIYPKPEVINQSETDNKGYWYEDKDGNKCHTWDFEESIGE